MNSSRPSGEGIATNYTSGLCAAISPSFGRREEPVCRYSTRGGRVERILVSRYCFNIERNLLVLILRVLVIYTHGDGRGHNILESGRRVSMTTALKCPHSFMNGRGFWIRRDGWVPRSRFPSVTSPKRVLIGYRHQSGCQQFDICTAWAPDNG